VSGKTKGKTISIRKSKKIFTTAHKPHKPHNPHNQCRLIPLNKITDNHINELVQITSNKNIMKNIGKGNLWTTQDIKQFVKDERNESNKLHHSRMYYSFILVCNNKVIGFIAGRKNKNLLPKNITPYDLLLRMFISSKHSGKGYGKLIIKLFIQTYARLISNNLSISTNKISNTKLFSDIDKTNVASIKIHIANGFIFDCEKIYPNGKQYQRYILKLFDSK